MPRFNPNDALAASKSWRSQSEITRAKIRTTKIALRLDAFANGDNDPISGEPIKMSPAQVNAAKVLLDKTLPSLSMSDIVQTMTTEGTYEEKIASLKQLVGEEMANAIMGKMEAEGQH